MHAPRSIVLRSGNERGVALITTLLIMMLMSALMVGFAAVVMSDQLYRTTDRDRARAFYGAQSGVEKLNADLANLFFVNVAPTTAQIAALSDHPPAVTDVTFTTSGVDTPYGVTSRGSSTGQISTGPYQGLLALKTMYDLDASVRTVSGGEAHLRRRIETVAIPVFQFGIFSDMDLSFHAGPNFNFGGRVHTNGNLFLAEGAAGTLTFPDKVTAVKEVIRKRLLNGVTTAVSTHTGIVQIATAPGAYRNLLDVEGSVTDSIGSPFNEPTWTTVSLSGYNGYIRNSRTGARALYLPVITAGGANADLVRRPVVNENVTNPTLLGERYFSKVSLRILLSDSAAEITNLPGVTATPPVQLAGNWTAAPPNNGTPYGPVAAARPPIALSRGPLTTATTNALSTATTITAVPGTAVAPAFLPGITLGGVTIRCLGKTAVSFTGCVGAPAWANGAVVTAPSGRTTTATAAGLALAATIPVVSTASFTPAPMWNGNNLVTCVGWTATTFTSCNYAGAVPGLNVSMSTAALSTAGTGVVGGFIKIERQSTAGVWTDVTMEILNYGIGGPNLSGTICADPTPNAIVRLQRLRDNTVNGVNGTGCNYAGSINTADYWPNALFDTREAVYRNQAGAGVLVGGVMYYVALDVANLSRWFTATAPYNLGTGAGSLSTNGYSVYFSDRRNNKNAASQESGEYGFEDIVNPADPAGLPNGALDAGEDVNVNGVLDTYGQFPNYDGVVNALPPGAAANAAPFNAAATIRPLTVVNEPQAKTNRAYLFRHALKLISGGLGNIVAPGFTVAAENPVYIQGDWNAGAAGFTDTDGHVATSVVADAVTLLSGNWNDNTSFAQPYAPANKVRSLQSYYRLAIMGGKNMPFPWPAGTDTDFGTDGGAHNFLRTLESGGTMNYRGSIATFFHSRQAVGTYKGAVVYMPPVRVFNFDVDFLTPAKLPPLTPLFRDLNALGFTQETRPGK